MPAVPLTNELWLRAELSQSPAHRHTDRQGSGDRWRPGRSLSLGFQEKPSCGSTEVVSFSCFYISPQGLRQPNVPLTSTEPTLEVATENWSPLKEEHGQAQGGPACPEVLMTKCWLRKLTHPSTDVLPRSFVLDTKS